MGQYHYDKSKKKWQTRLLDTSSRLFTQHFVAMTVAVVCLLGLLGFCTAALNQSLNGVEGGLWGWSGFAIRFNAISLQLLSGLLVLVFLLSLIFPRIFGVFLIAILVSYLIGWVGYTGLNVVQAINVHLDSSPSSIMCTQIVETVSLGCINITPLKGSSGKRTYCQSLMTLKGDESFATNIKVTGIKLKVTGIKLEADSVCFSTHSGFLGMPWINNMTLNNTLKSLDKRDAD